MLRTKVGCPACSKTIESDAARCPHCGARLNPDVSADAAAAAPITRLPTPFEVADVPEGGMFRRLAGRTTRDSAMVELRNLLATRDYVSIRESEVAGILAKARLLPRDVSGALVQMFEQAAHLKAFDRSLDDGDRRGLLALKAAFELTDAEAGASIERAVADVYEHVMAEALADGSFTSEERTQLEETARAIGIDEDLRTQLYAKGAKRAIETVFNAAIADRRYLGAEEQAVKEFADALGVTVEHDAETAALVDRLRLLGRIAAGDLPTLSTSIHLRRGEVCHFAATNIAHRELRTVTNRVGYSGPSVIIRIMKGVRWRAGSVSVSRITADVLTHVDTVAVYLTSGRLILQGERKNSNVPFSKMLHFTLYRDGLQIEKETGRDVYLQGEADWEVAAACLDAAMASGRGGGPTP